MSAGVVMNDFEHQPLGRATRSVALHALAAAFMCISPLLVFVPTAFISSGLRNGVRGAVGAVAGALALLTGIAAATSTPLAFTAHLSELAGLLLVLGLPSILCILLIRRGATFGQVMVAVVVSTLAGLFATEVLMQAVFALSPYQLVVSNFKAQSAATMDLYRQLGWSQQSISEMARYSQQFAEGYLVFMLESVVITTFALSLVMIPRLPAGRATGGAYLLRNFALPDWVLFAFVAGGLAPLAGGVWRTAGFNLLGIVVFLFTLQGLGVMRGSLMRIGIGLGGSIIALLLVALFVPFSLGLLFLVGLFDPFFDFRKLNRKDDSNESHTD